MIAHQSSTNAGREAIAHTHKNTMNTTTRQIGTAKVQGQEIPLSRGWNEILGQRVWITDTHHFAYANMDHRDKGWKFEADAEWARERDRISAEIYWGGVNPWRD